MLQVVVDGRSYEIDEEGFLQEPELWDEQVARDFATTENIFELQEDHWKLINYVRKYFIDYGVAPMVRKVCKQTGFTAEQIYELFPSGPAKGVCKVAGLPKPTGCV